MDKAAENFIDGLTRDELSLIVDSLGDAALEFADHGSNDLFLPATRENKAICLAVIAHHGRDRHDSLSVEETRRAKRQVFVYDCWAMEYFEHRCKARLKRPNATRPLAPAELQVIGTLLRSAAGYHEQSAGEVSHDLTFPASAANKALMAGVIRQSRALIKRGDARHKRAAQKKVAAAAKAIAKSADENDPIDIPDFWLMRYLAASCRRIARTAPRR
jgi:hypothetical protein